MKSSLKRLAIFLLLCSLVGCSQEPCVSSRKSQVSTDNVIKEIYYIKDPRTNICFAYMWGGTAYGGPALATVPCEFIPFELLATANLHNLQ